MTDLEELPTTDSGTIRKDDAMKWLNGLGEPDEDEMHDAIVAKPYEHEGSTYAEPFSQIRLTGTAEFVTEAAKHFQSMIEYEAAFTRLEINLKRVKDQDTGELTDTYALYLSVAKRGG